MALGSSHTPLARVRRTLPRMREQVKRYRLTGADNFQTLKD